jgi:hypothetical protein
VGNTEILYAWIFNVGELRTSLVTGFAGLNVLYLERLLKQVFVVGVGVGFLPVPVLMIQVKVQSRRGGTTREHQEIALGLHPAKIAGTLCFPFLILVEESSNKLPHFPVLSGTTARVAAIHALVAGTVAHHDAAARCTGRSIIQGVQGF